MVLYYITGNKADESKRGTGSKIVGNMGLDDDEEMVKKHPLD